MYRHDAKVCYRIFLMEKTGSTEKATWRTVFDSSSVSTNQQCHHHMQQFCTGKDEKGISCQKDNPNFLKKNFKPGSQYDISLSITMQRCQFNVNTSITALYCKYIYRKLNWIIYNEKNLIPNTKKKKLQKISVQSKNKSVSERTPGPGFREITSLS